MDETKVVTGYLDSFVAVTKEAEAIPGWEPTQAVYYRPLYTIATVKEAVAGVVSPEAEATRTLVEAEARETKEIVGKESIFSRERTRLLIIGAIAVVGIMLYVFLVRRRR